MSAVEVSCSIGNDVFGQKRLFAGISQFDGLIA